MKSIFRLGPIRSNRLGAWPTWGLIIQLIRFHKLHMQPLSSTHERMPPLFLISFAHHWKVGLSTGLHGAPATLMGLSSEASWGKALVSAPLGSACLDIGTNCNVIYIHKRQTVYTLRGLQIKKIMQFSLKEEEFFTWKKDSEFVSDRREGTKESGVILHERERQQRGPERIKQWREAVWKEKNGNEVV